MLDCARQKRICVRGGTELAVVAWLPMASRKESGSTTWKGAFFVRNDIDIS